MLTDPRSLMNSDDDSNGNRSSSNINAGNNGSVRDLGHTISLPQLLILHPQMWKKSKNSCVLCFWRDFEALMNDSWILYREKSFVLVEQDISCAWKRSVKKILLVANFVRSKSQLLFLKVLCLCVSKVKYRHIVSFKSKWTSFSILRKTNLWSFLFKK